ncbi:hypothetical protein MRX96_021733 [Rhipicephalus microplus]
MGHFVNHRHRWYSVELDTMDVKKKDGSYYSTERLLHTFANGNCGIFSITRNWGGRGTREGTRKTGLATCPLCSGPKPGNSRAYLVTGSAVTRLNPSLVTAGLPATYYLQRPCVTAVLRLQGILYPKTHGAVGLQARVPAEGCPAGTRLWWWYLIFK